MPPLIAIQDLEVHFPGAKGRSVRALDGVSLQILEGETLGLVGESGCGKTTFGRTILYLEKPTRGEVLFRGEPISGNLRRFRRHMQMIFQDPYASLDPHMSVGAIVAEPMHALGLARNGDARPKVERLLELVGLNPRFVRRYPHEFSGGQRQRIGIARALAAEPEFIVADEPISALDVSIQAQILNLLQRLQKDLHLTLLFISHDLRAVHQVSHRICVMYLGKIVEIAEATELYQRPLMPYTKALISAAPKSSDKRTVERIVLKGDIPSPIAPPSGCQFHTRCPYAIRQCSEIVPLLRELTPGHWASCIRIGPAEPDIERVITTGIEVQQ